MSKTGRTLFLMEFIVKLGKNLNIYMLERIRVHMIYSYKLGHMLKMTRESATAVDKEAETGFDGGLGNVSLNF